MATTTTLIETAASSTASASTRPTAGRSTSSIPRPASVLATVAKATKADVDRAVQAAHAALESKAWGGIAPAERGRIMLRIAQALRDRAEELATLESRDNGKPLRQARTDVQVAARYFEFFAGIADKIMGNTIPLGPGLPRLHGPRADRRVRADRAVELSDSDRRARRRAGARRRLHGRAQAVERGADDGAAARRDRARLRPAAGRPQRRAGHRLGSRRRARQPSRTSISSRSPARSTSASQVAKMAAENVVPVVMELGGKSPNIVFADADLDLAVAGRRQRDLPERRSDVLGRIAAARRAQGARRAGRAAGRRARRRMRVGPGVSDPDMGPIISKRQLETIERYVKIGKEEGATVAAGGERPSDPVARPRLLLPADAARSRVGPTCASRRKRSSARCWRSSTSTTSRKPSAIANRSQYGLVAGVWTRDINKAMALASRIKAGQVYINTYGAGGGVELPFGGYKKSGYGREKGLESLASYTQVKNVCVKFA